MAVANFATVQDQAWRLLLHAFKCISFKSPQHAHTSKRFTYNRPPPLYGSLFPKLINPRPPNRPPGLCLIAATMQNSVYLGIRLSPFSLPDQVQSIFLYLQIQYVTLRSPHAAIRSSQPRPTRPPPFRAPQLGRLKPTAATAARAKRD